MAYTRVMERKARRVTNVRTGQNLWQISPGNYTSIKAAVRLAEEIEANKDNPLLIEWKAQKADLDTLDKLLGHESR